MNVDNPMKIKLSRTLKFGDQMYSQHLEYRTLREGDIYLNGADGTLVSKSTIDLDGENRAFWPILKPIAKSETFFVYTRLPALGTLNETPIKLDRPKNGEQCFMRDGILPMYADTSFIYPIVME